MNACTTSHFFLCLATTGGEPLCLSKPSPWRIESLTLWGNTSCPPPLFGWGMWHINENSDYGENYPMLIKLRVSVLPLHIHPPQLFSLPVPASGGAAYLTLNLKSYRFPQSPSSPTLTYKTQESMYVCILVVVIIINCSFLKLLLSSWICQPLKIKV